MALSLHLIHASTMASASQDFMRTKLLRPLENSKIKSETKAAHKNPYKYEPLPDRHCFRLIKLPRFQGRPCSLVTTPIENAPAYATLSYTWGSPIIGIDEERYKDAVVPQAIFTPAGKKWIFIGRNLYDAINAVTRARHARYLWADALCINQADDTEKTVQIPLMGEIYSRCEKVILWLGNNKAHVDDMLYIHRKIAASLIELKSVQIAENLYNSEPSPDFLEKKFGIKIKESKWRSYTDFYEQRRWFSRLWVIQEVALPPKVQVLCGWKTSLSWAHLSVVGSFVSNTIGAQLAIPRSLHPKLVLGFEARLFDTLRDECEVGSAAHKARGVQLRNWTGARTDRQLRYAWLAYLLSQARIFEATCRQDKLYGVLGIFSRVAPGDLDPLLVPNASASVQDVYTNVAWLLVRELPFLIILSIVGDRSQSQVLGIPSWTPDYSARVPDESLLSALGDLGLKPNGSLADPAIITHRMLRGSKLELDGAMLDFVEEIAMPWEYLYDEREEADGIGALLSQLALFTRVMSLDDGSAFDLMFNTLSGGHNHSATNSQPTKRGLYSFLVHAILRSRLRGEHTSPSYIRCIHYLEKFEQHISQKHIAEADEAEAMLGFPTRDDIDSTSLVLSVVEKLKGRESGEVAEFMKLLQSRMHSFKQRVDRVTATRRLFLTRGGYVGVGAQCLRPGDQVWVLKGGTVLYVLREVEGPRKVEAVGEYKLVGEAFIYGLMHGEIMGLNSDKFAERVLLA